MPELKISPFHSLGHVHSCSVDPDPVASTNIPFFVTNHLGLDFPTAYPLGFCWDYCPTRSHSPFSDLYPLPLSTSTNSSPPSNLSFPKQLPKLRVSQPPGTAVLSTHNAVSAFFSYMPLP
ncbi:unnamed protein product [Citrullus colocynthis]|uniref:Uncharacterized protein n=1 Tax=Citrullus colocynthis TaxID=252529 RepID=A0ABP0XW16_9ROSI